MRFLMLILLLICHAAFAGSPVIWPGTVLSPQLLTKDGTVSLPGHAFSSETSTGLYRIGTTDLGISAGGTLGLEVKNIGSSIVNVGIGAAADATSSVPITVARSLNAPLYNLFQNTSNGTSSSAVYILRSGTSSNDVTIENYAKLNSGYLTETGLLSSSSNLLNLNLVSQFSSGMIRFNVGGAPTLANEIMRINTGNVTINGGFPLILNGSTSGALTISPAGTTTPYAVIMPNAQGTGALTNDGSGNLSWSAGGGTGTVTSVAMTVPSFLSISGSPITTSGTLAVSLSGTALPIANGGTAVTSVTTTPTASSFSGWDANKNLSANAHFSTYFTQAASSSTLTMTNATSQFIRITQNSGQGQTILLPDTSTLAVGAYYFIANSALANLTLNGSGGSSVGILPPNVAVLAIVTSTAANTSANWQLFGMSATPTTGVPTLPIAVGGTGQTSATSTPSASAWAGWDAVKRLSGGAPFNCGFTSTATAAGTTTMTIASTCVQTWTGATTQTIKLPTTSVNAGDNWHFINLSSGALSIQSSGANAILTTGVSGASTAKVDCTALVATPTTAANWSCI